MLEHAVKRVCKQPSRMQDALLLLPRVDAHVHIAVVIHDLAEGAAVRNRAARRPGGAPWKICAGDDPDARRMAEVMMSAGCRR
jgi:hypothetical protein